MCGIMVSAELLPLQKKSTSGKLGALLLVKQHENKKKGGSSRPAMVSKTLPALPPRSMSQWSRPTAQIPIAGEPPPL